MRIKLLSAIRNTRPIATRIVFAVVAALSISGAHYMGFLSHVPLQILTVAGPALAATFFATFWFYIALAVAAGRFLTPITGAILFVAGAIGVRITEFKKFRFAKFYLRISKQEGPAFAVMQILFFIIIFAQSYLSFSWGEVTFTAGVVAVVLALAAVLRTDALPLSPRIFISRLKSPARRSFRVKVAASLFTSAISMSLALAFYGGQLRADSVLKSDPIYYSDDVFSGSIRILLSSDNSTLAIEEHNGHFRYLYLGSRFVLVWEPKGISSEHFSKIKKKG